MVNRIERYDRMRYRSFLLCTIAMFILLGANAVVGIFDFAYQTGETIAMFGMLWVIPGFVGLAMGIRVMLALRKDPELKEALNDERYKESEKKVIRVGYAASGLAGACIILTDPTAMTARDAVLVVMGAGFLTLSVAWLILNRR